MSQYPPNPNSNPYGQNPSDPNSNQETAYGGPPSGPGPNQNPYNPYPNNPLAPGTNPNPYGPYGQNPPTPAPPPYNPYDQTVAAPNANYNPYVPPAPPFPSPGPSAPSRRGPSMRVILIAVIALVLVVGAIAFGFVSYNNTQQSNTNATATAQTNATATAHANATATFNAGLTATAIVSNFPFSANLKMSDPLSDNSKGNAWDSTDFCKFQGNAYHAFDPQSDTFNTCVATKTDFSNFTFQVDAELKSGDGIGITLRGNGNQLYRFMIFTDGTYNIVAYADTTSTNARLLTNGTITPTPDLSSTNAIAVVASASTLTFYLNQTKVKSYSDPTYAHGQIGVATYDFTNSAEAIFTNAKVWLLP